MASHGNGKAKEVLKQVRTPQPADVAFAFLTRRTVMSGMAAAAVGLHPDCAPAAAADATPANFAIFLQLSRALTGINDGKLSPFVDPINIKGEYFRGLMGASAANAGFVIVGPGVRADAFASMQAQAGNFAQLLDIAKKLPVLKKAEGTPAGKEAYKKEQADVLDKISKSAADMQFLARSIILLWYLGAWYDPGFLRDLANKQNTTKQHVVVSPKAYTQGWLWKIARAHPMGYSEMQFGYWHSAPPELVDFVGEA
jgi:hypothetical protein